MSQALNTNDQLGMYAMRLRGPDDAKPHTVYVEGPSLEHIIAALGGRLRDGGVVVWGGRLHDDHPLARTEPDMTVVPIEYVS